MAGVVLYGDDGRAIVRDGKLLVGVPGECDCCGGGTLPTGCCDPAPRCIAGAPSCLCINLPRAASYGLTWALDYYQEAFSFQIGIYKAVEYKGGWSHYMHGQHRCDLACGPEEPPTSGSFTRLFRAFDGSVTTDVKSPTNNDCVTGSGTKYGGRLNSDVSQLECAEPGCTSVFMPAWYTFCPSNMFLPIFSANYATAFYANMKAFGCNYSRLNGAGEGTVQNVVSTVGGGSIDRVTTALDGVHGMLTEKISLTWSIAPVKQCPGSGGRGAGLSGRRRTLVSLARAVGVDAEQTKGCAGCGGTPPWADVSPQELRRMLTRGA